MGCAFQTSSLNQHQVQLLFMKKKWMLASSSYPSPSYFVPFYFVFEYSYRFSGFTVLLLLSALPCASSWTTGHTCSLDKESCLWPLVPVCPLSPVRKRNYRFYLFYHASSGRFPSCSYLPRLHQPEHLHSGTWSSFLGLLKARTLWFVSVLSYKGA